MKAWFLRLFGLRKTTVQQMRDLFPTESRLKVRYDSPDARWRA